jgi:hypothetical protein
MSCSSPRETRHGIRQPEAAPVRAIVAVRLRHRHYEPLWTDNALRALKEAYPTRLRSWLLERCGLGECEGVRSLFQIMHGVTKGSKDGSPRPSSTIKRV